MIPFVNGSIGFDFALRKGSNLAAWYERAMQRESVRDIVPKADPTKRQSAMKAMAPVKQALEAGLFKREYRDHRLEWMIKSGGLSVVVDGLEKNNIRFTPVFKG